MKEYNIPLESFAARGGVLSQVKDGVLEAVTNISQSTLFVYNDTPIKSYIYLAQKFRLPFRIDMTVKIDSPALYLLVGKGHVGFATGMDNRKITDILGGDFKPNTHIFDNDLQMNEYSFVSVVYGQRSMRVYVNGRARCISHSDPYIKELKKGTREEFASGFCVALACDKRTKMTLRSFTVIEFTDGELDEHDEAVEISPHPPCLSVSEKPTLEECVRGLDFDLQKEIAQANEYLLRGAKNMRFKRKIEGGYPYCKISYVSERGLSYKIHITGATLTHQVNWIRYNTKRGQEKYGVKKADYTNEALIKLAEESPAFAREIFDRIMECYGCQEECRHRCTYEFNGIKKASCDDLCGGVHFKMFPSDFEDLRKWVNAISNTVH